jgi:hypothetical protein
MNRLRIETPRENKVTFSESINRLKIELTDPNKTFRTPYQNEIDIRKQGTETVLVMCRTNIKELSVKNLSNDIETIQTK